jgi:exodeoxyribonuclease VII small subunit
LLSNQQEPDIDQLLPLVEESIKAYNICKARLEAVQQALEKQIGAVASEHDPVSSQER